MRGTEEASAGEVAEGRIGIAVAGRSIDDVKLRS